jgi:DNA (cytosine-5)-methyltransferase 1
MTMRHIDLCSGIGGFALAAHWAGYQTEVFCERDEFCRKVLQKHWPRVPIVDDIHDFDGRPHAGADLLTGGIPCQPYSCAGKQLGDDDDRALWPQMLRVVTEARPHWIVVENVAGFIGMALDGVLADLEAEGYECGTVVLPACAVNAPHRRDRVWVVAHASRARAGMEAYRSRGQALESARTLESAVFPQGDWAGGAEGINASFEDVANTNGARLEERQEQPARQERPTVERGDSFAYADRESPQRATESRRQRGRWQPESELCRVAARLPARMDGHFDCEPDIPRVATGIPNRAARLKALGNAIVPQVAYRLFQAMGMADRGITESCQRLKLTKVGCEC